MNPSRQFISDMLEVISMPLVYQELRALFNNQEADVHNCVNVIKKDSMLSQRIINISNHPFFGFVRKPKNLNHAISLIGVMQLHDLMLGYLCMRAFSSIPKQIFNTHAFWKYSISCGIASKIIAQHSRIDASNQFFTLGIVHEIGHAAMFSKAPEISMKVLERHQIYNASIPILEKELLGFNYTELGAEMMRFWQLPLLYQEVAAHHLHPSHADKIYRPAVEVVHLAHVICQDLRVGQHSELIANNRVANPLFKNLPDNIDEMIISSITAHADSILSSLLPERCEASDTHLRQVYC